MNLKLKRITSLHNDKLQASQDDKVITLENVESWTGKLRGYTEPANISGELVSYRKGDVLFNKLRPYLAKVHLTSHDGLATGEMLVLRPDKAKLSPKYLFYKLISKEVISEVNNATYGVKMPRANWDIVGSLDMTNLPDTKTQDRLCNYLDSKTQTLDKILTVKNHTHIHLSELRQAIITNAILGTGGAAMNLQDTNIPWIGKIPVHWQMRKLKDIATVSIGWTPSTSNPEYFEGENVWVTIADMNKKYITRSKAQISDIAVLDAGIKKVPKGSLLYSFKLSVGKVAFAGMDLYTNEAIAAIIPKKDTEIDNDFLYYALSSYMISNANENIYGAKLLNQGLIKNAVIAVPPIKEQRKIAKMLNQKLDKIDHASEENQRSISQLEEYRSSLISNVVGGKVEV